MRKTGIVKTTFEAKTLPAYPAALVGIGHGRDIRPSVIVRLRNIDLSLNPFVPIVNLPDFTYKRSGYRQPGKGDDTTPRRPKVVENLGRM